MNLSVVMAVYNGAALLERTLESIFAQTERAFELIVIDDGSTDATPRILASCTDPRLRVLTQENRGLTRALARGCAAAVAPIVARHDCGDRSHPERFEKQLRLFAADPGLVLASCATSILAPEGETMYVARGDGEQVRHSLLHASLDSLRGLPHHGSAMFRRDAYEQCGGYREQFYFAQDLDLWVRLAALGRIEITDDVLYEARFDLGAISATNRSEQIETASIVLAIRDEPGRAAELLQRATTIRPHRRPRPAAEEAQALYFVASCLRRAQNPNWRKYARRAVRANPLLLRAWSLLVRRS